MRDRALADISVVMCACVVITTQLTEFTTASDLRHPVIVTLNVN